jgi:L-lactate dehydrogenase complex protein LldG
VNARDDILRSIRRHLPQATELPPLTGEWIRFEDPLGQFISVLESVGGQGHLVASLDEIPPLLGEPAAEGKRVVSCVPGLLEDRFDLNAVSDPHELSDVDLAIFPGQLAVAENGAVWVSDEGLPHRVLFFLAQHVALVVPRSAVVSTMHDAYERIEVGASPFGCFVSGPSKTADIEQSLVLGAHGARTLKVFLPGETAS